MIYPRRQLWQTSSNPWSLALTRSVNTGISYTTPSGTIRNQKVWASAGFRGLGGYGPTRTFPGGSGLDGMGCGCDGGSNLILYLLAGAGLWFLVQPLLRGRGGYGE